MVRQKRRLKMGAAFALALLLASSLAGCGDKPRESASGETDAPSTASVPAAPHSRQPETPAPPDKGSESGFPGSYTVPDGWVKMEQYSRADKVFYAEEGHEDYDRPDNISVEVKTNRYSAEDHMKFRDAIVRQLTMQASRAGAELTGEGTFTAEEDILYIFTISEEDVVTKQFYVVGDRRYCLIHLTNFTGSESADEAARAMADSFVWD